MYIIINNYIPPRGSNFEDCNVTDYKHAAEPLCAVQQINLKSWLKLFGTPGCFWSTVITEYY